MCCVFCLYCIDVKSSFVNVKSFIKMSIAYRPVHSLDRTQTQWKSKVYAIGQVAPPQLISCEPAPSLRRCRPHCTAAARPVLPQLLRLCCGSSDLRRLSYTTYAARGLCSDAPADSNDSSVVRKLKRLLQSTYYCTLPIRACRVIPDSRLPCNSLINISKLRDLWVSVQQGGSIQESVYGASISGVIDDVTRLYDVILVTPQSSQSSHTEARTRISYPCAPQQIAYYRRTLC